MVAVDDPELAAIRGSRGWRLGIWGLRCLGVAVMLFVILAVLAAVGARVAANGVAVPAFVALLLGVALGLAGVVVVTPRTSRYSGMSAGAPESARLARLIRAGISAVVHRSE